MVIQVSLLMFSFCSMLTTDPIPSRNLEPSSIF